MKPLVDAGTRRPIGLGSATLRDLDSRNVQTRNRRSAGLPVWREREKLVVQRTLQDRLQAARDERRRTAPLPRRPRRTATPETSPAEPDVIDLTSAEPDVIDLRTIRSMREAAARTDLAGDAPALAPPGWNSSPRASVSLLLQRQAALRGEPVPSTNPVKEPCPGCGGSVRLDLFDMVQSVAHLTCVDCGFLFTARSPNV
jgi:hypothetical protein